MTRAYWTDLLERAIRAAAWAALALLGADSTGVISGPIDWQALATVAGYAALASALASLAGSGVGAHDSASLLPRPLDPPTDSDSGQGDLVLALLVAVLVVFLAVVLGWCGQR